MNPAELEILRTAFAFIPEEMGVALQRSAYSPNIKERMDASCALFDEPGRMLSQAEHIPVHLGSMPASVEAVLHDFPGTLREGDQVILNDPYHGGTHLPDVTLVRPVFARGDGRLQESGPPDQDRVPVHRAGFAVRGHGAQAL